MLLHVPRSAESSAEDAATATAFRLWLTAQPATHVNYARHCILQSLRTHIAQRRALVADRGALDAYIKMYTTNLCAQSPEQLDAAADAMWHEFMCWWRENA